MAPATCAITYGGRSRAGKRLPTSSPTDTAGLRWHPDTWPMAYAMVSTVRPKASATPCRPIPTLGKAAARTALPHPPSTSQAVPRNSAAALLVIGIGCLLLAFAHILTTVSGLQAATARDARLVDHGAPPYGALAGRQGLEPRFHGPEHFRARVRRRF